MHELACILASLKSDARPAALATLVKVEGSSYRRTGARLLWRPEGQRIGSISGGCLEEDIIAHGPAVIASGQAITRVYDTTEENSHVWGVGLGCHGVVHVVIERVEGMPAGLALVEAAWEREEVAQVSTVFGVGEVLREQIAPPLGLYIFGAGDDAQPLARMATELGWRVVVADPRPAWPTRERFPEAVALLHAPAAELVAQLNPSARAAAVVMTHHYVHDAPILGALLPRPLAYLGLLGPKKRAEKILADLSAAGLVLTPAMRARLHAPVGLDLGGDTPAAVALSILAEIQATLAARDGQPLRARQRPIHHE